MRGVHDTLVAEVCASAWVINASKRDSYSVGTSVPKGQVMPTPGIDPLPWEIHGRGSSYVVITCYL